MNLLADIPVGPISAGGFVAIVILLILRGGLVTRQQLRDAQADRDKWREAAQTWQVTATQLGMSIEKLLTYAEMTSHALGDIRNLAQRASDQEGQR